jgi:hypothetical protein
LTQETEQWRQSLAVSERTFGVEIECTYGEDATNTGVIAWRDREPMRDRARKEISKNKELKRWADQIGIDGSGVEIRSPILKGQEGIEELSAMFDFLVEKGSTVTNQDGMHVHHGAGDFVKDWKKLYHACASWGEWTPQIKEMVAPRRRGAPMCRDAFNSAAVLKDLQKVCFQDPAARFDRQTYERQLAEYYAGRRFSPPVAARRAALRSPSHFGGRGAFNVSNVGLAKGTIEIRLAEGMMDRDSAVAWVKFGQRFLDHVAETETTIKARPKKLDTLLKAIQIDEDAAKVLKAKAKNKGNALVNAAPGKIANGVDYNDEEV